MIPSLDPTPARPSLALRIGITGSRKLRADQLGRIHGEIQDALASAKQQMERLSHEPTVSPFYEHEADGRANATLHMISPLARGADRLAARTAVELGYRLFVPMPFAKTEYEKDFTGCDETQSEEAPLTAAEDLAEFQGLLACASAHLALDGARDAAAMLGDDTLAGRSYEFVGRFVVRHSDLLIAVWDGKASNGRGGTADIVRYASSAGVPIWWIHATDATPPVWIADIQDLRDPEPNSVSPEDKLAKHLTNLIPAPRRVDRHDHGWIGYLGSLFRKKDTSPGPAYFTERARPGGGLWKTHAKVMAWASRVNTPWTPPRCPEEPVSRYWFDRYEPADARSGEYAARYRSGYVLVIFLTTLALVFGAFALGFAASEHSENGVAAIGGLSMACACAEFVILLLIVALVSTSLGSEWHERAIAYRLLAELFRKQQTLAPLGWTLSIGTVRPLADTEQLSWVVWLFAATQRAAPLPNGDAAGAVQGESGRAVLQDLIEEQLTYHHGRERMAHNASATFERLGSAVFLLVLICVAMKILVEKILVERWHWNHDWVVGFGVAAIVLFGISAASVALRSYAELQMLAEQSRHMIAELEHAKARVERLNLQRPLVSQDLGAIAASVAATMLQDLEGWGRLFRGKQMEAS